MSAQTILALCLTTLVALGAYNYMVAPTTQLNDGTYAMFQKWAMQNGKAYGNDDEKTFRYNNFKTNLAKVESVKSESYNLGLNKYADMDRDEFAKKMLGFRQQAKMLQQAKKNYVS